MTRVLVFAAAVGLFAALATGASAGAEGEAAERETCSASSLPPARPAAGLPPAVASLRLRIVAAARRCDYAALVRLGNEVGRGLQFSYGGTMSAPRFWRTLEAGAGLPPRPMEALVKLLAMPAVPVDLAGRKVDRRRARFYVWPPAHRQNASASDWQALRSLYTPAQVERMQRGRSYLGYRIGSRPAATGSSSSPATEPLAPGVLARWTV